MPLGGYAISNACFGALTLAGLAAVFVVGSVFVLRSGASDAANAAYDRRKMLEPGQVVASEFLRQDLASVARASAQTEVQGPYKQFVITLDHTGGERLGAYFVKEFNSLYVVRMPAFGGMIADWNAEHPDLAVRVGDRIVGINGKSGSAQAMLDQIDSLSRLRMDVLRVLDGPLRPSRPFEGSHYMVTLDRTGGDDLGMWFSVAEDSLLVQGVSGGLAGAWNNVAKSSNGRKIRPGDRVVMVNDVKHHGDKLFAELDHDELLFIGLIEGLAETEQRVVEHTSDEGGTKVVLEVTLRLANKEALASASEVALQASIAAALAVDVKAVVLQHLAVIVTGKCRVDGNVTVEQVEDAVARASRATTDHKFSVDAVHVRPLHRRLARATTDYEFSVALKGTGQAEQAMASLADERSLVNAVRDVAPAAAAPDMLAKPTSKVKMTVYCNSPSGTTASTPLAKRLAKELTSRGVEFSSDGIKVENLGALLFEEVKKPTTSNTLSDGVGTLTTTAFATQTETTTRTHTTRTSTMTPTTMSASSTSTETMTTTSLFVRGLKVEYWFDIGVHIQLIPVTREKILDLMSQRKPDMVSLDAMVNHRPTLDGWSGVKAATFFAARWTGQLLVLQPGLYSFEIRSDDGASLLIDGKFFLGGHEHPDWDQHPNQVEPAHSCNLDAGPHDIEVIYFDTIEWAAITLQYSGPDTGYTKVAIPPEVLRTWMADLPTDVARAATFLKEFDGGRRKLEPQGAAWSAAWILVAVVVAAGVAYGALVAGTKVWRWRAQRRRFGVFKRLVTAGVPAEAEGLATRAGS